MRKHFGTDGVRGTVGQDPMTPDFVLRLGFAAGRALAGTGKRLTLELGGKAANIVFDDCALDQAVEGIKAALGRGFRVTTNTTLFDGASPLRMRKFFDEMMALGVEGMMISPGYSYSKAPDQEHFPGVTQARKRRVV